MIVSEAAEGTAELAGLFEAASVIVPFTGAGISTECGIPDFRSPGGLWTVNRPIPFDEFLASKEMRDETWRRRFAMDAHFREAQPGRGHRCLAALYRRGKTPGVITQNIDNLHQASGVPPEDVLELHGNTTYASCLTCGKHYELAWVRERFDSSGGHAPDCACGGYIKSATISFGQPMPAAVMRRGEEMSIASDLFVAIGSSLVVWPAAGLPLMAKRAGARLIIINREPTDFDSMADLVVRGDIGTILGPLAEH
jgi:NAD-dependent deacetylase